MCLTSLVSKQCERIVLYQINGTWMGYNEPLIDINYMIYIVFHWNKSVSFAGMASCTRGALHPSRVWVQHFSSNVKGVCVCVGADHKTILVLSLTFTARWGRSRARHTEGHLKLFSYFKHVEQNWEENKNDHLYTFHFVVYTYIQYIYINIVKQIKWHWCFSINSGWRVTGWMTHEV